MGGLGGREGWAAGRNSPKLKSLNLDRKGGMKEGREKRREGEREEGNRGEDGQHLCGFHHSMHY